MGKLTIGDSSPLDFNMNSRLWNNDKLSENNSQSWEFGALSFGDCPLKY